MARTSKYAEKHPVTSYLLAVDAVVISRKAAVLMQSVLKAKGGIRKAVKYARRKGASVPEGVTLASFTQAAKKHGLVTFQK